MEYLYGILTWFMDICYGCCHNYGMAILLFTLCSKLLLLPVSIWTYRNSIVMIKIQPDINEAKARYYGQPDKIAEEQAKLFQKYGYHPLASTIPLLIQLVLLIGVVGTVQAGIADPEINMVFGPVNLGTVPGRAGVRMIWIPVLAGFSSWILCMAQNTSNVLQSEQSKLNKYGTMLFSVGLSLYLGWYVPAGTAFYWICSNSMAVIQLYILNAVLKPRTYVDYDRLNESRKALHRMQNIGKKREPFFSENKRRERKDYKKFFSVVNKHLVFYSESSGFYKYYQGMIEYLLEHTNLIIHYITSDPMDQIFEIEKKNPKIRAYYIGENRLITLMMKMDADMVVMTMPDLDNYHIKRSYVSKEVEYVHVPHGMGSANMTLRKAAMDHFDTIFCTGKHQKEEVEKTEAVYHLPKKKLVEFGYPLLDQMRENYGHMEKNIQERKQVLIAPSWQKDNIIESCLDSLLAHLKGNGYQITVRPHPQHVRHQPDKMEQLKEQYANDEEVWIQTDFSSNRTVFLADIVITDWSDIAYEYSYTTCRPVLFIDTPMKVMNPEYQRIDTVPINIWMRERIGKVLKIEEIGYAPQSVADLLDASEYYRGRIQQIVQEYVYHPGTASQAGANYIIGRLKEKAAKRKERNQI